MRTSKRRLWMNYLCVNFGLCKSALPLLSDKPYFCLMFCGWQTSIFHPELDVTNSFACVDLDFLWRLEITVTPLYISIHWNAPRANSCHAIYSIRVVAMFSVRVLWVRNPSTSSAPSKRNYGRMLDLSKTATWDACSIIGSALTGEQATNFSW